MAWIAPRRKCFASYHLFIAACWDRPMTETPGDLCLLQHRVFALFGEPLFRRADTDGTPVMLVMLGDKQAAIPLRSLQHEFGIPDDSPDGRMLGLIAQALDYVSGLRPGDPLPSEVLSGDASWEPDPMHLQIANARLEWQLVAWLNSGTGGDMPQLDADALLQIADDPARRRQVQAAFAKAADVLGLASSEALVQQVEELAQELAYIEALRDRLLRRIKTMAEKLGRLAQGYRGDASHLETLTQVRRLAAKAVKEIGRRFDELDAQTGEVMAALRNAESQRVFIRSNRDWLYRSQRAWHPLLLEWDVAGIGLDEGILLLLNRTYQFLAPRFMPMNEWLSVVRPVKAEKKPVRRMVW
jgi:hypothetical protein